MAATVSERPTHVQKACAYITRENGDLLVFEGPGHDGLQIPKGTLEGGERPREALFREVVEESGLGTLATTDHLVTDVWTRRRSKRYVRHFYHATVYEAPDEWTHVVTGDGEESGETFAFRWVDPTDDHEFALDLDDYLHALPAGTRVTDATAAEA
jgi:8-oxo-dGTP pyrophosphatase MutT (NUDIX family)